jgi:hypothetical protein
MFSELELNHFPSLRYDAEFTEEYVKMKNFIISTYSLNPTCYISATDCRRKMAGDAGIILKIHDFLDGIGEINQFVPLDSRPITSMINKDITSMNSIPYKSEYVKVNDDSQFIKTDTKSQVEVSIFDIINVEIHEAKRPKKVLAYVLL